MYPTNRRLVMISIRGDVTATAAAAAAAGQLSAERAAQAAFVLGLSTALTQMGQPVEVWTRRCGDRPEAEELDGGVRVRRFACGDCGSVRELTPGEYVAEWVGRAAEHLACLPVEDLVLVSHYWDAGIAGKMLASRLGLAHVHVPHALGTDSEAAPNDAPAARDVARRVREEREVYRTANRVVATGPRQRAALLGDGYRVPASKLAVVPEAGGAAEFLEVVASTVVSGGARWGMITGARVEVGGGLRERPPGVEGRLARYGLVEDDSIL